MNSLALSLGCGNNTAKCAIGFQAMLSIIFMCIS